MVAPGLRQLLDRGLGVGDLDGPDVVRGDAEHPVCGDHVELSARVVADVVREVRWRARGCPASMAIAALCSEVLVDVPRGDVERALRDAIAAHGGLARHEHHAESMVLRALRAALGG